MSRVTSITFAPSQSTHLVARALECAMRPFGSLAGIDAASLVALTIRWIDCEFAVAGDVMAAISASADVQECDHSASVEFGGGGITIITPTSGARIEVSRTAVRVDFGTAGSTQRAAEIIATAEALVARARLTSSACGICGLAIATGRSYCQEHAEQGDPWFGLADVEPGGALLEWTVTHRRSTAVEREPGGMLVELDPREVACLREVLTYADQRACEAAGRPIPGVRGLNREEARATLDDIDTIRAAVGWPTGRAHEESLGIDRRTGRRSGEVA